MISRQQADARFPNVMALQQPRMDMAQRAVIKWATIEEYDRVLDVDCGNGALLHALADMYRVSLCGLCESLQQARATREVLDDADVAYATACDIPFRSESFDEVFITRRTGKNCCEDALQEVLRVLRPGGQIIIACRALRVLTNALVTDGEPEMEKREIMRALQQTGFKDVSWRSAGLAGVVIGWKKRELE